MLHSKGTTRAPTITTMPVQTRFCLFASRPSSKASQMGALCSYLHVASPLSLPFQQGIQDSPAGLLGGRVIPTHHVVRWPHSLEKFHVNILTVAVVGDIAQVQIHGKAWRHGGWLGRLSGSWSFGNKDKARVIAVWRHRYIHLSPAGSSGTWKGWEYSPRDLTKCTRVVCHLHKKTWGWEGFPLTDNPLGSKTSFRVSQKKGLDSSTLYSRIYECAC